MNGLKKVYKIRGVPKGFENMVFGRQIEHLKAVEAFKESALSTWISQKRRSSASAIREAVKLYEADEYYCSFHDSPTYWDDSFQFWYKTKATA